MISRYNTFKTSFYQEKLKEFFPTDDVIYKQREVVTFWAGLEEDPEILYHFCVEMFQSLDVSLLISISRESGVKTFFQDLVKKLLEQKPKLKLSNKDMNGLLSVILPSDASLQSLEVLNLWKTELNESDVQHLGGIIGDNKLPALKHLHLGFNTLTGGLPELLPPDASLPSLEVLLLYETKLHESDVQHLGGNIRDNKLPALKHLNLCDNTLTGLLPELLPPDASLPSLEWLNLESTGINESDVQHLGGIIGDNKLPALKDLYLCDNTLTGLLPELLPSDVSIPSLEMLHLSTTGLNESDVQHLGGIIRNNKLPALRYLDPEHNILTGLLPELLPLDVSLPSLEWLNLESTGINESDVQHLGGIIRDNKLPALKHLNLKWTTVTGLLPELLPLDVSLPSLEVLNLGWTRLNKSDVQHLGGIIRDNKLPALKELYLNNTLTGLLPELLPSDASLLSLEWLDLRGTKLNGSDVQHLGGIIRDNKLPELGVLYLIDNDLSNPEDVFGELLEACVTHYQKKLKLWLWCNKLTEEFRALWERRCEGTNVNLTI